MDPQEEQNLKAPSSTNFWDKIKNFKLSNQQLALLMIVVALMLFIPLAIFVNSALKPTQKPQNVSQEKKFKPSGPYVADEIIIKYKDSYTLDQINNLKQKLDQIGVVKQEKIFTSDEPNLKNYYLVTLKKGSDVVQIINSLRDFPEVETVGPDYIVKIQDTPNDTFFPQQWGLSKIHMPDAWGVTHGSSSVRVAVIDTGIDYTHQDFSGRNIAKGPDFVTCDEFQNGNADACIAPRTPDNDPIDDQGHGTHVAGIIGAVTNNGVGISGINWDVTLMAVKSMNRTGRGKMVEIAKGIDYAVSAGANIINMSVAQPNNCNDPDVSTYKDAVENALSKGVIVVAAAGNGDTNHVGVDASGFTPASCDGVITVGATDQSDQRPTFSNFGSDVSIAAPGVGIYSTYPSNKYVSDSGTSMAAPHVAGVAALLLAAKPGLSPSQVKSCLVNGADAILTDKPIGKRINALNSLNLCSGISVTPSPAASPTIGAVMPTISPSFQGKINGIVFVDPNGNGQQDVGEAGMENVQIITEGTQAKQATTDKDGKFDFSSLGTGTYQVSAFINGVKFGPSPKLTLDNTHPLWTVSIPVPPIFATPEPGITNAPAPTGTIKVTPVPTTPTPTPVQTYTCRQTSSQGTTDGAIQIGTLECVPNK